MMRTSPPLVRTAVVGLLTLASAFAEARADTIVIPGKRIDPPPNRPDLGPTLTVTIKIKDAGGNVISLPLAIVDTGNVDGLALSATDAAKLGLAAGTNATAKTAGGTATLQKTDIPASRNGSFDGEKDSSPGFKAPVSGTAYITSGKDSLVGTKFFDTDPKGAGAVMVNYAAEQVVIYNNDQAKAQKHSSLDLHTPMTSVAAGSFDVGEGNSYSVEVGVTHGGTTVDSPFVISTGLASTLISTELAAELGIVPGPMIDFTYVNGTFDIPSAMVDLGVFAQGGPSTIEVGILPDSLNPDDLNFLGGSFLGQFSSVELDAADGIFFATVPEPASVVLLGASGALLLAHSAWRRRGRGRAAPGR